MFTRHQETVGSEELVDNKGINSPKTFAHVSEVDLKTERSLKTLNKLRIKRNIKKFIVDI